MFEKKIEKKKFAVMQYHTQRGNARVQVGAAPVNQRLLYLTFSSLSASITLLLVGGSAWR